MNDATEQPVTVYTADDFEPEVVTIPPPTIYSAEDFQPEVIRIAPQQPKRPQLREDKPFYGDVLNYPDTLDYPDISRKQTVELQQTDREQFERELRGAVPAVRPTSAFDPIGELVSAVGALNTAGELAGEWAAPTVGPALLVPGLLLKILGEIDKANKAGRTLAQRNAFKWGWASTMAALAEGQDWVPTLPSTIFEGYRQRQGRNAALRAIKAMGPDTGTAFLRRYVGNNGFAQALTDLGGYETDLPPNP
jgi:hypothetical protein